MKKFHVGIQLYGVRNTLSEDFYGTLKAIRDMGYEYVEFAGYAGTDLGGWRLSLLDNYLEDEKIGYVMRGKLCTLGTER